MGNGGSSAATPELHLPGRFRWSVVTEWVGRIASPAVATRVRRRLEELRARRTPDAMGRGARIRW